MLATVCTCLFSFAAMAAMLTILMTLKGYAPDVARLRLERSARPRDFYLSWRIIESAAVPAFAGIQIDRTIRASRLVRMHGPCSPPSLAA